MQQLWLQARTGRSPKWNTAQGNVRQSMLQARTGRSPKGNTAQGNTLGVSSLTNWRAVSAAGASEVLVRFFLLLFQSASLLEYLYPGRCPGLYSYWAFSPSLLATSTLVRCHGYTPVELSARLCSHHQLLYGAMRYTPVGLSACLCSQHQLLYGVMGYTLLGFQPVFTRNINCCTVSMGYAPVAPSRKNLNANR